MKRQPEAAAISRRFRKNIALLRGNPVLMGRMVVLFAELLLEIVHGDGDHDDDDDLVERCEYALLQVGLQPERLVNGFMGAAADRLSDEDPSSTQDGFAGLAEDLRTISQRVAS